MSKNYFINLSNQLLSLFVGLLITSYLSKHLGVDAYGSYAFIITIATFCLLFTMFGITNYAPKAIAQSSNITKTFSDIFSFQLINTFIVIAILGVILTIFHDSIDPILMILLLLYVTATSLNCSWLFIGTQNLKINFITKVPMQVMNLLFAIMFVTNSEQLYLYLFFVCITSALSSVLSIFFAIRKYKFTLNIRNYRLLFPILLQYFIPILIISMYTIVDKILLGVLTEPSQVGYFTNATTIVKMLTIITSSLNAIVMPNIALNINDLNYVKNLLNNVITFSTVISFVLITIILTMSTAIVMILFGEDFTPIIPIMIVVSPIIYLISLGNIISLQYLTAAGENKKFAFITLFGAVINIIINLILIPIFGAIGAAVSTLIAEVIVTILGLFVIRKIVSISNLVIILIKSIVPSFISVYICAQFTSTSYFVNMIFYFLVIASVFSIFILINDVFFKEKIIIPILKEKRRKHEENISS